MPTPCLGLSEIKHFTKDRVFISLQTEFFQPLSSVNFHNISNKKFTEVGLNPPETWNLYSSTQHEGTIYSYNLCIVIILNL